MASHHVIEEMQKKHDSIKDRLKNDHGLRDEEREELEDQLETLKLHLDFFNCFVMGEEPSADPRIIVDSQKARTESEQSGYKYTTQGKKAAIELMKNMGAKEAHTTAMLIAADNTNMKIDAQTDLLNNHLEAIRNELGWSKWETRIGAGLASLLGIIAIVVAIAAWRKPVDPSQGGSGTSGGNHEGSNSHAMRLRTALGTFDQKSMKETMEAIVTARAQVGDGLMDKNSILGIFADHADTTSIDDQDSALVMFGSAAVEWPETRKFFWQDPSHMLGRIEQLHRVYLAGRQLSDVYRKAEKLEYDGKPIPFFQTASVLQSTLALISVDG
jgi:hypothetical protein